MRKSLLIILVAIVSSLACNAEEKFIVDDICYEIRDGKICVVTGYIGSSTNLVIPNTVQYNGKSWPISSIRELKQLNIQTISIPNSVKIGWRAFENCKSLKRIEIPSSMTEIEYGTFDGCTSLKTIIFRGNITKIEGSAFENCGFETFQIPNTVKDIGRDAFRNCKNMKSIDIPASVTNLFGWYSYSGDLRLTANEGWCGINCDMNVASDNPTYSSENGILFNKDKTKILHYPEFKGAKTYIIPTTVNAIGEAAFSRSQLQQITIPETVKTIEQYAFSNSQIENIVIPPTLLDIRSGAFSGCEKLKQIELPQLKTIPDHLLIRSGIESIVIPNSVKSIDEYAFYECKNLKSVAMSSVESIGKCGFRDCKQIREVSLSNMLKTIGEQAFLGCTSLETVIIPNSVTSIGDMSFYKCTNLKKVIVPDKASIYRSFSNCSKLEEVKGYTILYPDYLNSGQYDYDQSSPFYVNVIKNFHKVKQTFSYYAYGKVNGEINAWQKKKEYETTEQWKNRVTESTRQQKVNELMEQARKDYVAQNKPNQFNGSLGTYDADYSTFPLKVSDIQTLFISVPQSEAQQFKEKWNKVKVEPVYGVINDYIGIFSCSFTLKGKTYGLSQNYSNDNSADLALNLSPLDLDLGGSKEQKKQETPKLAITIDHTIDQNIPAVSADNKNTFAVIIGNERYTQVAQVPFANNDARIFAEYCKKTLGLPEKNVKVYENASYGTMIGAVSDIQKIAKAFKGDISVIFYYAGHGIPDEATGDVYLLPIDADGLNMRVCYPLSQLYKELGEMNVRNVTCFMDACFSGAQRGNGMVVAARGVAIKAKTDHPTGNTVVFTAATDKQTAFPYEEKGHGMFTYYLLKKLRETKGDCTLGELGTYISDEVAKQAVVTNGKEQTPVVLTSAGVADNWKMMKLK